MFLYFIRCGDSAAIKKHIIVGQKYFKGEGANALLERQKCTKYNKINNN